MKVRVKFSHVDPYTLELIDENMVITIDSVKSAIEWVRQSYFKVWTVNAEKIDGRNRNN